MQLILLQNPDFDPLEACQDILVNFELSQTEKVNQDQTLIYEKKQIPSIPWEVEYVPLKEAFAVPIFYEIHKMKIDLTHDAKGRVLVIVNEHLLCFDQELEK